MTKSFKSFLSEGIIVHKTNYKWGRMMAVNDGAVSFPLHPEHQEKIKNLKDGQTTKFVDAYRTTITARREGKHVHLKRDNHNRSVTIDHSHF